MLAHESHRLEDTVMTLILLFLLALNDLADGGAIFHHFSRGGHGEAFQSGGEPVGGDLKDDYQHVYLNDGHDEQDRDLLVGGGCVTK